jgi:uncharacterized protein (DUF2384 family)
MGRNQKLSVRVAKGSTDLHSDDIFGKRSKSVSSIAKSKPANRKIAASPRQITRESVSAHALETFGSSEKAQHWLNRPNPLFQGKTPAEVVKIDPMLIEAELVRIDHGVYM